MVIVDTSIWVTALRVRASFEREYVASLVSRGEAAIIGLILTEVLRGARSQEHFDDLLDRMEGCEFIDSEEQTWRLAGEIMLGLRLRGETVPFQDAIIAAHALLGEHEIYSTDQHFARVDGLRLHAPV